MAWKKIRIALAALAIGMAPLSAVDAAGPFSLDTVVKTDAGYVSGIGGQVRSYKGIPFAAPPIGPLRYAPPRPVKPWDTIRSAKTFSATCQIAEDCLTLNVWTPRADVGAKLPVMVWLHGGAFVMGAGSQSIYDGAALGRRGAVIVSLNYRLGPLGYFVHPALEREQPAKPANFGLLDQIAALRWIQANIAAFGGDANNVTIFGESAGAQSVLALFVSPLARGLFHKGIAQSAYGIPSHTRAKARTVGIAVANAVGVNGGAATLEELRAIPADKFAGLDGPGETLAPSLVVGDEDLPMPILSAFQRGLEAPVPLIIGSNSDEASVAVAFGVDPAKLVARLGAAKILVRPLYPGVTDPSQLGREVVRDVVFGAYARRIAYLHSARAPTWRYYYSRIPSGQRTSLTGVPHGGEIPDVFGADEIGRAHV